MPIRFSASQGFDLVLSPTEKPKIEAIGFQGRECLSATKEIEELLGAVSERQNTREMYQEPAKREHLRNA